MACFLERQCHAQGHDAVLTNNVIGERPAGSVSGTRIKKAERDIDRSLFEPPNDRSVRERRQVKPPLQLEIMRIESEELWVGRIKLIHSSHIFAGIGDRRVLWTCPREVSLALRVKSIRDPRIKNRRKFLV